MSRGDEEDLMGKARSLPKGLALCALCALGCALAGLLLSIACSSSSGSGSDQDAGADGAGDALDAADANDGFDPTANIDPTDNDPMGYEPSLDIVRSWIYFDNGQPWVRVEFAASWPPPATLAYWSCSVSLGTADAPVETYTAQDFSGTRTDTSDTVPMSKITFAAEPKGFRVLFADATLKFDHYAIETSVKATNDAGAATLQDTNGAFAVTTRMQRTFGP
jgi:hypothetical protein